MENNIIYTLTDSDFGTKKGTLNNPSMRYAARGIVINGDKIGIFNKQNKNEFKLPGGGMEENEDPAEAFKRECLEETGCEIEVIDNLGIIIEEKSQSNFKQISYVLVGKVTKDTGKLNLTQKEIDEGAVFMWTTLDNAIELTKNCLNDLKGSSYDNLYSSKFMVKRDNIILNYYKNKIENK